MRLPKAGLSGAPYIAVVFLLLFAALAIPGAAAPARQAGDSSQVGPITALALDNSGNGWAWADSAPQKPGTNYLLKIQNGTWTVAADTTTNATLLPSGLTLIRMVLTADGTDGWAVARTAERDVRLWRYQKGTWKTVPFVLPAGGHVAQGMTITADGTDGWMSVYDQFNDKDVLFRLRSGAWKEVPQVSGGSIIKTAISPDGKSGWAGGYSGTSANHVQAIFRLTNGAWVPTPAKTLPDGQLVTELTADNTGHGWAIIGTDLGSDNLVRLSPDNTFTTVYSTPDKISLSALAVDGFGRGWALGAKDLGQVEDPGGIEFMREAVLLRLNGDKATEVAASSAAFSPNDVQPDFLALTPSGGHAWVGAHTSIAFGRLFSFREPWLYSINDGGKGPNGLAPLPGSDLCFSQVQYCLRGKFLDFWQKNGGLEQLGLPITTEINETIDGKNYLVQYTERARLEYHPENASKPGEVLLGLLGNILADARKVEAPFLPTSAPANPAAGTQWFAPTQHNLGAPFLAYWQTKGGLPVFGYPRSEAFNEQNQADDKTYRVQYFERNRIEYHPENAGTQYEFLLGLLGTEQFKAKYGFTP